MFRVLRKGAYAAFFCGGDFCCGADVVGDEGGRGRVGVAAAVELLLEEGLNVIGLLAPDLEQVCPGGEGLKPFVDTEDEGEDGAADDEPAVDLEPGAGAGDYHGGDGEEGGDEYYYCVGEEGLHRKMTDQNQPSH